MAFRAGRAQVGWVQVGCEVQLLWKGADMAAQGEVESLSVEGLQNHGDVALGVSGHGGMGRGWTEWFGRSFPTTMIL